MKCMDMGKEGSAPDQRQDVMGRVAKEKKLKVTVDIHIRIRWMGCSGTCLACSVYLGLIAIKDVPSNGQKW